jgi:hypothetical protein
MNKIAAASTIILAKLPPAITLVLMAIIALPVMIYCYLIILIDFIQSIRGER